MEKVWILTCLLAVLQMGEMREDRGPGYSSIGHRAKRSVPTTAEVQQILDKHSALRRLPEASNMMELTWSDDLAALASQWADACDWTNGQPAGATLPYSLVGQNMYYNTGTPPTMDAAIQSWSDQEANYDYDSMTCTASTTCKDYLQIVWADTIEVGCGYTECPTLTGVDGYSDVYFLVCNYGPGADLNGQIPQQNPYLQGSACSACPTGTSCNNDLCLGSNECTFGTYPCHANADCTPTDENTYTLGGETCTCKAGYTGDGTLTGTGCEEYCQSYPCHADATCAQLYVDPGYNCTCKTGYTGDGTTECLDECSVDPAPCDANAACTLHDPLPGHDCTCNPGYEGNGLTCTATANGCSLDPEPCDPLASCTDAPSSDPTYSCACPSGYAGDGVSGDYGGTGCTYTAPQCRVLTSEYIADLVEKAEAIRLANGDTQ